MVLLAIGAGAGVYFATAPLQFASSVTPNPSVDRQRVRKPADDEQKKRQQLSFDQFAAVVDQRLQRPLIDPPPKTTKPVAVAKPAVTPLELELVGTAVDDDATMSRAWLRVGGGEEQMVAVGKLIKGAKSDALVTEIESGRITVTYGGQDIEFEKP